MRHFTTLLMAAAFVAGAASGAAVVVDRFEADVQQPAKAAPSTARPSISSGAPRDPSGGTRLTGHRGSNAFDTLHELEALSEGLIEEAASGQARATEFRIQSTMYRERLRRLMLDDRQQPEPQRLPRTVLVEMVRMSALLHAAAACRTGRVITCPPDLMRQLRSQQRIVTRSLSTLRGVSPVDAP